MEGPVCEGIVKMDISNMRDGDVAGFAAINGDSGLLSVLREGNNRWLSASASSVSLGDNHEVVSVDDREMERVALTTDDIYLKINADFNPGRDIATFAYSTDGQNWTPIGSEFKMVFDYRRFFMGTRFAIYNYATASVGGHVDVDFFRYTKGD